MEYGNCRTPSTTALGDVMSVLIFASMRCSPAQKRTEGRLGTAGFRE
jgi:hypothetical protein